jgi:hypothetical protein
VSGVLVRSICRSELEQTAPEVDSVKLVFPIDLHNSFLKYGLIVFLSAGVFMLAAGCGVAGQSSAASSSVAATSSGSSSTSGTGSAGGSGTGSGSAGSGSGSSSSGNSGSSTGSGSSAPDNGNATVLSNLQTASGNWRSWGQVGPDFVDCPAPCSESTWQQTFGVATPSDGGNATKFEIAPNVPYADVLFSAGLHHFVYDTDFYVTDPSITQSLEFDLSLWMSGIAGMTFGHQCNHLGDGAWDIWNNGNSQWVSTKVPCQFTQGWNHLTLQVQIQPDNSVLYQSITLNGDVSTLNITSPAGVCPQGWWGLAANYQMDSDYQGAPNTTYLDNLSVSYW